MPRPLARVRRVDGPGPGRRYAGRAANRSRSGRPDPGDRGGGAVVRNGAGRCRRRRGRRDRRLLFPRAAQRERDPHGPRRGVSPRRVHADRPRTVQSRRPEPASRCARASGDSGDGASAADRGSRIRAGPAGVLRGDAAAPAGRGDGHGRRPPGRRAGRVRDQRRGRRGHRPVRFPDPARRRDGHGDRIGRHRARRAGDRGSGQSGRLAGAGGRHRRGAHGGRAALHGRRGRCAGEAGARCAGAVRGRW